MKMNIKSRYEKLYELYKFLTIKNANMLTSQSEIESISESLLLYMEGLGQQAIYSRISNYNKSVFKEVVDYTRILAEELDTCARVYNSECDSFKQRMMKEVARNKQKLPEIEEI